MTCVAAANVTQLTNQTTIFLFVQHQKHLPIFTYIYIYVYACSSHIGSIKKQNSDPLRFVESDIFDRGRSDVPFNHPISVKSQNSEE